jgi:hypothetical protein
MLGTHHAPHAEVQMDVQTNREAAGPPGAGPPGAGPPGGASDPAADGTGGPETGPATPPAAPSGGAGDAAPAAGAPGPAVDEAARLQIVRAELGRLAPWGPVTAEALDTLETHFRTRQAAAVAARQPAAPAPAAGAGTAPAAPAAPSPRRPATPSLYSFLADHSILIVSYVGAFLLIVATLLFELYGAETLGGAARFAVVLVLDLVFGAAGWWCLRRPQLRLVGRTYVAIFALLAPLVFVAAYTFLLLEERGIPVALAQAVAGGSCALLYGLLAVRLGSSGYAALSLTALPVGWAGAATLLAPYGWRAAAMTPLIAGYSVLAFRPPRWGAAFARPAAYAVHAVAAVVLIWLSVIELRLAGGGRVVAQTWGLPAALAGLALGYAAYCWLGRHRGSLWTVAVATTLTALTASAQLEPSWLTAQTTVAIELMALAWVYGLAAGRLPAWGERAGLHAVAGLQALLCVALVAQTDWLQAAVLLAGAALGVVLAVQTPNRAAPAWLLLTGVSLTAAWYRLARLVAPELLTTDRGRVLAFLALPAALAIGGAIAGRRARRSWSLPLYATAAAVALWVTAGAFAAGDAGLLAAVLLLYAALVYALSVHERFAPGVVAAALLLFGGVASMLQTAGAAAAAYPPVLAALAWAVYGAGGAWDRRREATAAWTTSHRDTALAAAGLVALACLAAPEFYRPGVPGALAAAAALWSAALMLFVDGRRRGRPLFDYAAGFTAALGSCWLASYFGATNPQWYVAVPGLFLVGSGPMLARDPRRPASPRAARLATGSGLALLAGTSAVQSLTGAEAAAYTVLLVLEGVAALLGGIALRNRTLVLGGGLAVAVGGLRAIFLVLQEVPLFAVFGVVALVLLGGAALLAVLRARAAGARSVVADWATWQ